MKNVLLFLCSFTLITTWLISCQHKVSTPAGNTTAESAVVVFNANNEASLNEYERLNLDETHQNLLDPQKSKADHENVIRSWSELHRNVSKYLSDKGFEWQTEDSSITIVHKIYFNKEGKIHTYFFNILTPGIEQKKQQEYGRLLADFAVTHSINLKRETNFAQCGKTRYVNKN